MIIDKKHLNTLQILKIKNTLDEFPLPSNYLYINELECVFITKYKYGLYQVCCSPVTKLCYIDSQSYFNVLFSSKELDECKVKFHEYVKELLCRV